MLMNDEKRYALLWTYNDEIIQWLAFGTKKMCYGAMYDFFQDLYPYDDGVCTGKPFIFALGSPEFCSADGRDVITVWDISGDEKKADGYFHIVEWGGKFEDADSCNKHYKRNFKESEEEA